MRKLITLLIFSCWFTLNLKAQQQPVTDLYLFEGLVLNPAYAGSQVQFSTSLIHRDQWVNFPGAPVMPGVLQVESMAQCGGILVLSTVPDPENYLTYFMKMNNVKFKQKVLPGDTLIFKAELMGPIRRGICHMQAYAYANNKLVAEAELMAQIVRNPDIEK